MARTATLKASSKPKIKIKPLGDRVLVEPRQAEEMTPGGIVLPDAAQEKQQRGIVRAIGDKCEAGLVGGNEVIYSKYGGTEIEIDDVEYVILKEADILAVQCTQPK